MPVKSGIIATRFVPIGRRLFQRVTKTLSKLAAEHGDLWVRRWPEIVWQPPFKDEGEDFDGLLVSTIRLSRKDGCSVDDVQLGMRIKPLGARVWRDETLRDSYA